MDKKLQTQHSNKTDVNGQEKAFILNERNEITRKKSMTMETSKNLGGIGALLIFVGPLLGYLPGIGGFGGILSLIGAILVLIALKGFADYYRETGIFNNGLYALITAIAGGVLIVALVIFAFVDLFAELGLDMRNIQDWSAISQILPEVTNFDMILRFAGIALLALVVLFLVLVFTAFFLRRSLGLMATKTGVGLFGTAGLLLLIGAVLTIIIIGIFLVWIALLLVSIAFFSVRVQQMPPPPASSGAQTPV